MISCGRRGCVLDPLRFVCAIDGIRIYTNVETKAEYTAERVHHKWAVRTPMGRTLTSVQTLEDAEAFMRGDLLF